MKAKQITSIAAVALMAASMGAPAVSAEESTTDYGGITLTLMNSKPEIQSELEKVTSEWGAEHNVTFDVYKTDAASGYTGSEICFRRCTGYFHL